MKLPFDPEIPLLGLYSKNPETPIQKHLWTPMFIALVVILAKYLKQPKCPSVKEWMEYYATERKGELLPFMTMWIELESIMLSEMSQTVKDKYHMSSSISGI